MPSIDINELSHGNRPHYQINQTKHSSSHLSNPPTSA